jgi:importin subunit alpha-1
METTGEFLTTNVLKKLPEYVSGCRSDNLNSQLEGVQGIRKLLSIERNPPIQQVLESGILPQLVAFLTSESSQLVFESCWALTNIASGNSAQTNAVVNSGAVPLVIQLLKTSQDDDVKEQAVWFLGNAAGDSTKSRDLLLNMGVLDAILALNVPELKFAAMRNATWTISNLARGKPQPALKKIKPAIHVLSQLIEAKDDEVLTDACWALSYISDGEDERIQVVIEYPNIVPKLVELLMHKNTTVKTPALRTIGNIATGNDMQTQKLINAGVLPALVQLMKHAKKGIRKEAVWTISNITAGDKSQIQKVLDTPEAFETLAHLLKSGDLDVKKEAAWAISNAIAGGSRDQIVKIATNKCIAAFCSMLHNDVDSKVLKVCLEGLQNILKAGSKETSNPFIPVMEKHNLLGILEVLNEDEEVYQMGKSILDEYFGGEAHNVGEVNLSPDVEEASFDGEDTEVEEPGSTASPTKKITSRIPKAQSKTSDSFVPGETE